MGILAVTTGEASPGTHAARLLCLSGSSTSVETGVLAVEQKVDTNVVYPAEDVHGVAGHHGEVFLGPMLDANLDPFDDFGPNVQFQEDVEGDDEEVFYRNCPNPLCVILLFTWFARAWFLIDLISYLVLVDVIDSTIHCLIAALTRCFGATSEEAATAFAALQRALTTGPVLQMPDFDEPFVVDCDASGIGFGAVFHQGEGPLAFFRRPFAARHHKLAAYERELIGLVQAHQWISKLFGFDFTVEYRPGRLNTVADALSRRDIDDARTRHGRCGPLHPLRAIFRLHRRGHEGVQKTLHRLRADFYIQGDGALVRDWVRACVTCQRNKTETLRPAGLLQPLDVPSQVWADISMDFIEGLPKVGGKSVILTVVDRFSKYAHFIALGHPYTAACVARAFFDGIVRLHGFPSSIVSDRDPVFTGHVWRDLFGLAGMKLRMSTAFHPQTDGQSEVVNKIIAMYLRCITGDRPRAWVDWLAWAEYCYNTSYHSALHATPFEVVYGRPPPAMLPYAPGTTRTETADDLLRTRDDILAEARQRLLQAQQLARRRKLGPRYAGPFRVLEHIGTLAYRLELPAGSRLHDVFNVGLLKAYRGDPPSAPPALPPILDGRLEPAPASVARVMKAQQRRGVWHVLVHWTGMPEDEATWEKLEDPRQQFPEVQLEDVLFEKAGRDVMVSLTYTRKKPTSG
ncbi:hypothetical protein QYE76_031394 [Lolium multiflorum]|uniref:Uncharacterized protein n=1 Tax=Lolium multiflorum TaxID=4521 RepID=A0AAD8QT46_LOLMU|nr:hypothetical protein QYE76_031394 [Lolium multiflorum]